MISSAKSVGASKSRGARPTHTRAISRGHRHYLLSRDRAATGAANFEFNGEFMAATGRVRPS